MRVVEVQTGGESAIASERMEERRREKRKKNERETTTERGRMVKTGGKKREDRGSLFLSLNGRGEDDDGREVRSKMERE